MKTFPRLLSIIAVISVLTLLVYFIPDTEARRSGGGKAFPEAETHPVVLLAAANLIGVIPGRVIGVIPGRVSRGGIEESRFDLSML